MIVCTNSGIKVYDVNYEQLIEDLEDTKDKFVNPAYKPEADLIKSDHFLKYKLSALPNEKIIDLVMLKAGTSN